MLGGWGRIIKENWSKILLIKESPDLVVLKKPKKKDDSLLGRYWGKRFKDSVFLM